MTYSESLIMAAGNPLKNYSFAIASDVNTRDGIGCEVWDVGANEMIAEVFRDDTTKQITFTVWRPIEIPLEILDRMLQLFDKIPGRTFIDYDALSSDESIQN